jgi:hypothetical protein
MKGIVGAEYNAQTSLSAIPVMVMVHLMPITIIHAMFVNPFVTNAMQPAQIHSWWYEEIVRIDKAHRNSDPPHIYISVVNDSSQQLVSSLTLCIKLSYRLVASMQQWYTSARPQSTLITDFQHSCL